MEEEKKHLTFTPKLNKNSQTLTQDYKGFHERNNIY